MGMFTKQVRYQRNSGCWSGDRSGNREGAARAMMDQHTVPREARGVTAKGETYCRCRRPQRRRRTTYQASSANFNLYKHLLCSAVQLSVAKASFTTCFRTGASPVANRNQQCYCSCIGFHGFHEAAGTSLSIKAPITKQRNTHKGNLDAIIICLVRI